MCGYIYNSFFIHSSVGEHLGCFHELGIVNNAVVNIEYMYFFKSVFCFFSEYILQVKLLGHSFNFFEKLPYCFLQWMHLFTFPPAVCMGSLFSTSLPTCITYSFFWNLFSFGCTGFSLLCMGFLSVATSGDYSLVAVHRLRCPAA